MPILDPKSLEETKRRSPQGQDRRRPRPKPPPDPSLDAKGLPPGYPFKPDWEVTPREVKAMLDKGEKFVFIDCRLPNEYQITAHRRRRR